MRNVSLLIPQWAVSLCVPGSSVASVVRSTHAALSPFQSQYFVVIAADCFQGGEHMNTGTCGYYATPPPLHHTRPASVFVRPVISLFFSSLRVDIPLPLLIISVVFSVWCVPSICSVWIHLFFRLPSSPSIFVSPAAGNEYLIYSLSLLGDGLRE